MFALFLQGFCDELKQTVAYIGTQLEERGERVNWRKLDGDLKDKGQGSVLHTMGTLHVIHPRVWLTQCLVYRRPSRLSHQESWALTCDWQVT